MPTVPSTGRRHSRRTHPSGLPKLGAGELRAQVLTVLAAEPSRPRTAGQIARTLGGRSAGAVRSALERLDNDGLATAQPGLPRYYQITAPGLAHAAPPRPPSTATEATPEAKPSAPPAPAATSAAAVPGPVPPHPAAVRRPNGAWYIPRTLAGRTDLDVLRDLRTEQIPALLYGPPGTGKTSLVEAAFPDVITVGGHGDTTVEDFLGSYVPEPGGGFTFTHGPLVVAMREGRALFVDDGTLIAARVLAVLYPVMDGRGTITIPAHHHETVTAAPGFYVAFGHNPGVHGAVLTDALASRLGVHIEVTTDFALARSLGVPDRAVAIAQALNNQLRKNEVGWAPQLRELLALTRVADVLGVDAALANLAGTAPEEDRPAVINAIRAETHRSVAPLALGDQI